MTLERGTCVHILEGHAGRSDCVSMTQDGRRAVSGSEDSTMRVWEGSDLPPTLIHS